MVAVMVAPRLAASINFMDAPPEPAPPPPDCWLAPVTTDGPAEAPPPTTVTLILVKDAGLVHVSVVVKTLWATKPALVIEEVEADVILPFASTTMLGIDVDPP
jgi:hypothetical protein